VNTTQYGYAMASDLSRRGTLRRSGASSKYGWSTQRLHGSHPSFFGVFARHWFDVAPLATETFLGTVRLSVRRWDLRLSRSPLNCFTTPNSGPTNPGMPIGGGSDQAPSNLPAQQNRAQQFGQCVANDLKSAATMTLNTAASAVALNPTISSVFMKPVASGFIRLGRAAVGGVAETFGPQLVAAGTEDVVAAVVAPEGLVAVGGL
jgi:hypothetical protein